MKPIFFYSLHIFRTAQPHYWTQKKTDKNEPIAEGKIKLPVAYAMPEQLHILRSLKLIWKHIFFFQWRCFSSYLIIHTYQPIDLECHHRKWLCPTVLSQIFSYVCHKLIQLQLRMDIFLYQFIFQDVSKRLFLFFLFNNTCRLLWMMAGLSFSAMVQHRPSTTAV